jgi:hypothetical protein
LNFFFKEFSFLNLGKTDNSTIKTFYIKTKQRKFLNYMWLVKYFHKIPYDFGATPHFHIATTINKPFQIILVKGDVKKNIIEKITTNKVINIENLGCPAYSNLESTRAACLYHSLYPSSHCSALKVSKIFNWLENVKYCAS